MPTNKQRREAERRRLQRQLERRREREARHRKLTLITSISLTVVLLGAIVLAVVGLSSRDDTTAASKKTAGTKTAGTKTASSTASASPSATAATYPCKWYSASGAVKQKNVTLPSTTTPPKTGKVSVSVATTRGKMTFTLDRAKAPCTVASFVSLVNQKFYDKTPCHRLVTSSIYVLQCGDPSGKGTGGPGYGIPDEATGKETYPAGTIAMARSTAADSGGSQFFIVYKNSPKLMQSLGTKQYTVFGQVSSGLSTVSKVAAGGTKTGADGAPKLGVTITSMTAAK